MEGPTIAAIVASFTVFSGICCLGTNSLYRTWRTINFTNELATRCVNENKEFSADHGHWSSNYKVGSTPPLPEVPADVPPVQQIMQQSPFEPFALIPIDFLIENGAKLIGAGAATIASAGAAIGIGNVLNGRNKMRFNSTNQKILLAAILFLFALMVEMDPIILRFLFSIMFVGPRCLLTWVVLNHASGFVSMNAVPVQPPLEPVVPHINVEQVKTEIVDELSKLATQSHLPPCPGSSFRDISTFSIEETSLAGLLDMREDLANSGYNAECYIYFLEAYGQEIEYMLGQIGT